MAVFGPKVPRGDRRLLYLYFLAVWIACCLLATISVPAVWVLQGSGPSQVSIPETNRNRPQGQNSRQKAVVSLGNRLPEVRGQSFYARRASKPSSHSPVVLSKENGGPRQISAPNGQKAPGKHALPPLRVAFNRERPDALEACVIPDVCMAYNFSYKRTYVPESYRAHKTLLSSCLRKGFEFYDPAKPPPELQNAVKERHDFDIVGVPMNSHEYAHFAHFIMEFVRHLAVPASLFLRPDSPISRWMCPSRTAGKFAPCNKLEGSLLLKPMIALSKRMLGKPRSWNRGFFAMLTNSSVENPRHVYIVPPTTRQPALHCFRSMLATPLGADTSSKNRDTLLRKAGISRKRISTCSPRIVVVVRNPKGKVDRTIPMPLVRRLHHELAARIPTATVEVFEGFDGLSVRQQAALMQRTDILVSVHGAELSNLIFIRRGASVIQLFPFGFRSRWFDPLMDAVGATHVEAFVKPDTERFLQCVKDRTPKLWPNLAPDVVQRVKTRFLQRVDLFERAGTEAKRDEAARFNGQEGVHQVCTRSQRIFIDPVKIALLAVEEARKTCKVE